MKKSWIVTLVAVIILVAGYGSMKSFDKSIDESSFQAEALKTADALSANESEHVECDLKDSKDKPIGNAPNVFDGDGKIRLGGIGFFTSLESGLEKAKSTERTVFLYLHSKSCGWCKKFEEEVLTDSVVISVVEDSFIPVAIEINEQKDLAEKFKVYGTPTMVFLEPGGDEIYRIRGFMDAKSFAATLDEI